MKYQYNAFIPQQIAPRNAKNISVYNGNGEKIYTLPLGRLRPISKTKLYSVGIVADVHCADNDLVAWTPVAKLDKSLTYFENELCAFCANSGDMTQTGFYTEANPNTLDVGQFAEYKGVCDSHTITVHELSGNHENYVKPITNNLTELRTYTGTEMYYSVPQDDDLYIFLSQPSSSVPMTDEALQWLYETLEANRNKRCFIFVHPYIGGGNTNGVYGNDVFSWWGTKTTVFVNLLKHYKNTVLFHGHSHNMFECQELDKTSNYSESFGFKSVHIPSLCRPTYISDGVRITDDSKSYGYLMEVYDDCVVLNGRDFIKDEWVPTGVFKINTTLVEIQGNTFTDSTGTITT